MDSGVVGPGMVSTGAPAGVCHLEVGVTEPVGAGLHRAADVAEAGRGQRDRAGGVAGVAGDDRGREGRDADRLIVGEWGREFGRAVVVEERRRQVAGEKLGVPKNPDQLGTVGGQAVDLRAGQRTGERGAGLEAGATVGDDLGQHRVVVDTDLRAAGAGLDAAVQADAGTVGSVKPRGHPGHLERPQGAGAGRVVVRRILGIQPGLDRPAVCGRRFGGGQGQARRDVELQRDQVQAGGGLGDGVLHLQAGVHLEEEELAVVGGQELDRAGAGVADRGGRVPCRGVELVPHPGRALDERAGRLLDDLLVPALDGALALPHRPHGAVRVGHDLDLDVAAALEVALAEHRVVAERRFGLAAGGRDLLVQGVEGAHDAHAPTATAGGGLDQHRQLGLGDLVGLEVAEHRHARVGHHLLGLDLGAHGIDRRRRRSDPGQVGVDHRAGKIRVLGQEPVAGVDRVGTGRPGGGDHRLAPQVGLGRGVAGQPHRRVGLDGVRGTSVGIGVHGDRGHSECPGRVMDAPGDLAAVGHQNGGDRPRRRCRRRKIFGL